jgi:hypothetical protein
MCMKKLVRVNDVPSISFCIAICVVNDLLGVNLNTM